MTRSVAASSYNRHPTGYDRLSDDIADRVDQVCDEFERCLRAGQAPAIEDFLTRVPAESRHVLLLELILLEIPYRHSRGEPLSVEKFCNQFPEVDRTWVTHAVVSTLDGGMGTTLSSPQTLPSIPGYEILEEIGRGSMGVVYRAIQLRLGRIVAVKTLPVLSQNQRELLARFRSEAEAVAKLHHVGIVQIFDVDYQAKVPFFSMEHIAGGSLAQLIKQRPLHPRAAAKLVAQLAEAIHYAHEQGIIHRDLKPENVLLQQTSLDQPGLRLASDDHVDKHLAHESLSLNPGQVTTAWMPKITDFGLAKQVDSTSNLTLDGALLGTPSYMAPEQTGIAESPLTRACDIYGLGAILYAALVGRPPFHAANIVDTIQLVRDADPTPPSRLQPGVRRDLETICLKCLAKKPGQRFANAQELADDLNRFLAHKPIRSRSISLFSRMRLWRHRNQAVANMLIAVVATLAFGICGTSWLWLRAEQSAMLLKHERDKVTVERTRAQLHLDRSREAVDGMVTIGQILLSTPGKEKEGRDALQQLIEYCEGFLDDDSNDPIVRYQTAVACLRLGRVNNLLGQSRAADSAFKRSRELLQSLKDEFPEESKYSAGLAYALSDHANLLRTMEGPNEAEDVFRLAIDEWEQIIAAGDSSGKRKMSLANVLANFVLVKDARKHGPELKEILHDGIRLVEDATARDSYNREWQVEYVVLLESLANLHITLGELSESERILDKVMTVWKVVNPTKGEQNYLYRLALTHMLRAKQYLESNKAEQGIDAYRDAIAILSEITSSPICLQMYRESLLDAIMALTLALESRADKSEIRQLRRQACQVAKLIESQAEPNNTDGRIRYANTLLNCAVTLDPKLDLKEIESCYKTALLKLEEVLQLDPQNLNAHLEHALALDDFGMHQYRQRNLSQAEILVVEARDIREQVAAQKHGWEDVDYYRARSRANLAAIYRETHREEQGLILTAEAIDLLKPIVERHPNNFAYRKALMELYSASTSFYRVLGKHEQAWRAKLKAYLHYTVNLRLPNAPTIDGDYHRFPLQLALESQDYLGASQELAKKLLEDLAQFDAWMERYQLDTNPRIASVYHMSSSALIAMDINYPILDLEQRALKLAPEIPEYMNTLAWWLANSPTTEERDPQAALVLSNKALTLKPIAANFHNTLALIHIRLGNWEQASEEVSVLTGLRKSNWYDLVMSAMVKLHFGDRQLAEQLVEQAKYPSVSKIPKFPESPDARRLLVELETLLNQD